MKKILGLLISLIIVVGIFASIFMYISNSLSKNFNKSSNSLIPKKEIQITIPEGSDIFQIAEIVSQKLPIKKDIFIAAVQAYNATSFDFIDAKAPVALEGYLFPDTYKFFEDVAPDEIIAKMLSTFEKKALPVLKKNQTDLNEYQLLTLASIIQKEVFTKDDMKQVAGIFYNRLKIDMKLQSDATINYVTKTGDTTSSLKDLQIESPYNTYKYKGLPPSPITNSGVDAIEAVINPSSNSYFYFLTTSAPENRTIFSRTLEEHNANKQKYLK